MARLVRTIFVARRVLFWMGVVVFTLSITATIMGGTFFIGRHWLKALVG